MLTYRPENAKRSSVVSNGRLEMFGYEGKCEDSDLNAIFRNGQERRTRRVGFLQKRAFRHYPQGDTVRPNQSDTFELSG